MDTLLLIDGNAIMHRAFHALPPLTTKEGVYTNAVHGFFIMLHKAITDLQVTHVIVTFDTPVPTFRKKMHKEYQAHRPSMINEMKPQFPLVKELLDLGGIKRYEKEGFEADDVIGTLSKMYKDKQDFRVFILTGDRDILQLVDDSVFVISPLKGMSSIAIYNKEAVFEKFGVKPEQIPDFKALMGDASDNYKGAKGIGPKTAMKLLQQFQTVERVLSESQDIKEERIRNLITEHIESIEMSKQLATILRDVELECNIEECRFDGFKSAMRPRLEELQLYSLIGRLFGARKISTTEGKLEKHNKKEQKKDSSPQLDLFS